jgi:hypothetical protein
VRKRGLNLVVAVILLFPAAVCQAVIFPLEIFTNNSPYANDPGWDLYVDVWDGTGVANFTFYNGSSLQSSMARIFFDDGSLLGVDEVINSDDYTFFKKVPAPQPLPGWDILVPPFEADREYSIGTPNPPPWKGVNDGDIANEWVTIRFNLINGGTLDDVINELYSDVLRIGVYIIDLPEGYTESAVTPEPATVALLGLGTLFVLRRKRR